MKTVPQTTDLILSPASPSRLVLGGAEGRSQRLLISEKYEEAIATRIGQKAIAAIYKEFEKFKGKWRYRHDITGFLHSSPGYLIGNNFRLTQLNGVEFEVRDRGLYLGKIQNWGISGVKFVLPRVRDRATDDRYETMSDLEVQQALAIESLGFVRSTSSLFPPLPQPEIIAKWELYIHPDALYPLIAWHSTFQYEWCLFRGIFIEDETVEKTRRALQIEKTRSLALKELIEGGLALNRAPPCSF